MINLMKSTQRKVTDFNVGSIVRSILEAVAAELDELYQQMFSGLKEAIPVSVYNSFDFPALPALPSGGLIRVTITSSGSPIAIPIGTVFTPSSGGVAYTSLQSVTIAPAGTTADVPVAANIAGLTGNIAASTTFVLSPVPTNFVSATNLSPFINGADVESEDDRKVRFRDFVKNLARGTVSGVVYGLKQAFLTDANGNQIERVVFASLLEPWITDGAQPIGLVNCYVHNGIGSTSSTLVTKARDVVFGSYATDGTPIPGYKGAGVKVVVAAATEVTVAVTAALTVLDGYVEATIALQAAAAISAYIQRRDNGEPVLKAEIVRIVMNIPGVYNFVPSAPASDVTATKAQKLMPGTITIT